MKRLLSVLQAVFSGILGSGIALALLPFFVLARFRRKPEPSKTGYAPATRALSDLFS